ncbi:glycoside hydrolase family 3 C-terminal domain-containing protein [Saccharothrix syringae]|uniref:Beta-glucosidase n=1 Tax=Saccharothrix syringae TaxID=103733 RepID=A0A5Q0H4J8_SACSY|nr:glycoside hydrolase family 3 C-terminal domain-containing protein [Saccharothrix syringae]QFZ20844.1 beta-glucosidase [Saccharothrix syringae]
MSSAHPGRRRVGVAAAAVLLAAATVPAAVADTARPPAAVPPIYLDTHHTFAERAADLVSRMSLDEKVPQLRTSSAPAIPRLGVQQYTYWSEGQHGLNTLGANTDHGSVGGGVHATSFPTNFAAAMSWDPELVYRETTAISDEARAVLDPSLWGVAQNNLGPSPDNYGSLTYWAPTVNMDRDPRWGRTDEAFGEDPLLVARMAGAFVNGYQGQTRNGQPTSRYLKVAATAKHYALNDVEDNRHADSSDTTDANIRDYYTPQFRSLVEKARVSGLMTSYNAINGTPAPADTYTANALAQRTYGFDGYTTSDCGAVGDIYSPGGHNWAPPGWTTATAAGATVWTNTATGGQVSGAAGGQAYALRAGTQLNCTGAEATPRNIREAIAAGVLDEGVVDDALTHVFTLRMRTGEFDPRDRVPYTRITKDRIESPAHRDLAEEVATNSLVLLENDPVPGTADPLLPADPAKLGHVVVVGDLANKVTLGGYSGDPTFRVNAVQGITSAVRAANPGASVVFDACGTSTRATTAAACAADTLAAIRTADLVVVFVGTDERVAGEGRDRATLAMPGNYGSLIEQVRAVGNQRMALAVQAGGPVRLDDVRDAFPAVVFSGYNGQGQGTALANVLFGEHNPSGHLNFTWYRDDAQLPDLKNYGLTPSQTGGLGRTYQYFTGTPSYPFGHGLSYTTFRYSHVTTDSAAVTADGSVVVGVDVTNTGAVPGAAVAQLYVATPFTVAGVELPRQRLAGFRKTPVLRPGETRHLTMPVRVADLATWDQQRLRQVVHNGRYAFGVGPDSGHLEGSADVVVTGSITPRVRHVTVQPDHVVFSPGERFDLTGRNPWIADVTAQADRHAPADHVVEAVNNDQSFVDLRHARVRYRSSDPDVARVDDRGTVTAVAPGAATVSVTVDGVTGTTPIVVKQPFTLDAPTTIQPGSTFTATTTLPNPAGGSGLRHVSMSLEAPDGWTVRATSPSTFARVAAGRTVRTTWRVDVPDTARPGRFGLSALVRFTSANGPGSSSDATTLVLPHPPYPSLAAAFNNVAVTDDGNTAAGDFDGDGSSFSAQALAAATPSLTPGAAFTHNGLNFTWPDAAPGTPDNVVAGGQTIAITGSGTTLGLIGAGDYGAPSGTVTVTYTDGTTGTGTVTFADWWTNVANGGDVLTSVPYINKASGRQDQRVSLYYAAVPLQAGKTVRYVTLPDISEKAVSGSVAMHVFALAIGG